MPRVTVESYDCLTVKFAEQKKAQVMLRGMRNLADVEYEFQLAMTNRTVAGIETVFVMTSEEYGYVNSTMVRQLALLGGEQDLRVPFYSHEWSVSENATSVNSTHAGYTYGRAWL